MSPFFVFTNNPIKITTIIKRIRIVLFFYTEIVIIHDHPNIWCDQFGNSNLVRWWWNRMMEPSVCFDVKSLPNIHLWILRRSTNERTKCQIATTQRHDEFVTPPTGIKNVPFRSFRPFRVYALFFVNKVVELIL